LERFALFEQSCDATAADSFKHPNLVDRMLGREKMSDAFEERPGRSWEEYWTILLRRRWWILLPFFFCWAAVWEISWLLPVQYQSESVLGVSPQIAREPYVSPDAAFSLPDWLQNTTQHVLTRSRLQELVDEYHLSPGAGTWGVLFEPRDPVDRMHQDIQIEPIELPGRPGSYTSFRILCLARSPQIAQKINEQVTFLFLTEIAMGERQSSEDASAFLDDEVTRARENVTAQETKIEAFQEQHLGQLPVQLEGNVQVLGGLQTQLQSLQRALDTARQQKLYLDSLLEAYRSAQANADAGPSNSPASQALDQDLIALQLKLETLRSQYTEDYPDIAVVKQAIAKTEELKKQLSSQASPPEQADRGSDSEASSPAADAQQILPPPILQAESQLKANALEIQNDQQRERELESQIATYQSRLNLAPETEQALDELSSGYEESKRNYDTLLEKQMQAHLAANREEKGGDRQLQVLDPPSLPVQPSSPNRMRISLVGLLVGLAIGLAFALEREMTDSRVRDDEDLDNIVPVPVLVSIPRISTPRENTFLQTRVWIEAIAATAIVALILAGNLFSLYLS
jgi:succinoglycan biosynthesis transport protein ExoP